MACQAHDPAHPLHDQVVRSPRASRAVLTESRDVADDRPAVDRTDAIVGKAEPAHDSGAEVLDDDVAAFDETLEDLLAFGTLEIARDAALVAVDREVVRGDTVHVRGSPLAGLVPATRDLDLHHVGAVIGEQQRAIRSRESAGQVDHADRGERTLLTHAGPRVPLT